MRRKSGAPSCAHAETTPVELAVTGERVATLCLGCGMQLGAEHRNAPAAVVPALPPFVPDPSLTRIIRE